jgi:hypothetical protein
VPFFLLTGLAFTAAVWWFHDHYTLSLQSPVRFHLQSPIVVAERVVSGGAAEAQADQHGRRLSAWHSMPAENSGRIAASRLLSSALRTLKANARLPLQLGWNARLGLLPDQHGSPQAARYKSS